MKIATRLTLLLLALLMLFSLAACDKKENEQPKEPGDGTALNAGTADIDKTGAWQDAIYDRNTTLCKCEKKTITVKVIAEEQELTFTIHTDKATLGEALLEHGLIAGDQGAYGMYIKKVNGIVADYDVDQTYWSLTKNGELMMVGADMAVIADGEQYELTKTK